MGTIILYEQLTASVALSTTVDMLSPLGTKEEAPTFLVGLAGPLQIIKNKKISNETNE